MGYTTQPKLYRQLASWFHLLTAPEDYREEAEFIRTTLTESAGIPVKTVLELGSGGGNNALHLKKSFDMTLVDLSEDMLKISRQINPECEHIVGDMRDVRLGRQFDAVLVHDAVMYMTDETDLNASVKTAAVHCKPGGVALFLPDFVRETFTSGIHHGGHDAQGRGLRYLEWTLDPDPSDSTYTVDFAIIIRDSSGVVRFEHDQHVFGLFGRQTWLAILTEAGFAPRPLHDDWDREVFAGRKGLEPPKG